jgi:Flp pilus assembly protein TadG
MLHIDSAKPPGDAPSPASDTGPSRPHPGQWARSRELQRRRQGNFAVLVAVSASSLIGMGALAIDTTYSFLVKAQAQAIADIGAHAALVGLRQSGDTDVATSAAEDFVQANKLLGQSAIIDPESDISFGTWDFSSRQFAEGEDSPNSVRVTVRKTSDSPNGAFKTLLMGMFGEKYGEISATQPAVGALRTREIFVVQDVTPSFSAEIDLAREADLAFLNAIAANNLPNDAIGMVTFVGGAETFTPLQSVLGNASSIASEWEELDWCDRDYHPYNDPSWEYYFGGMFAHATSRPMMDCNTGNTTEDYWHDSGTNQGEGMFLAMEQLLDDDATDPYALKVLVLVSDGAPACATGAPSSCAAGHREDGYEAADWAEDNNISVFSVSYNETYDASQSAFMEDMVRGYGEFYETPTPDELPEILETIARSIPISLVQ